MRRTSMNDISLYANYAVEEVNVVRSNIHQRGYEDEYTYLLPQADSRASVEWEKYERPRGEVLLETFVEKTIWIELLRCGRLVSFTTRE